MIERLAVAYSWFLAAHIIFIVFWVAGLFMLPRYLVYHQEALRAGNAAEAAQWVHRETMIRRMILSPAMIVVWVLGLTLATIGNHWSSGWLHAKLLLVVALTGYHHWAVRYAKRLAAGEMRLPDRRLRMLNEVPALALTLIVVLVVVKPF